MELENPFGLDANDLPLEHFQQEMNDCHQGGIGSYFILFRFKVQLLRIELPTACWGWGLGLRVEGSGFRALGLGFSV